MRLAPIVAELDALRLFRQTGGAIEYVGLKSLPGQLPAAFAVSEGETAAENRLATGHDQRVIATFAVMLVLGSAARREGAVDEQLHDLAEAVKHRLTGWRHPDATGPTAYAGGGLAAAGVGSIIWAVRFRTPEHLRKVN